MPISGMLRRLFTPPGTNMRRRQVEGQMEASKFYGELARIFGPQLEADLRDSLASVAAHRRALRSAAGQLGYDSARRQANLISRRNYDDARIAGSRLLGSIPDASPALRAGIADAGINRARRATAAAMVDIFDPARQAQRNMQQAQMLERTFNSPLFNLYARLTAGANQQPAFPVQPGLGELLGAMLPGAIRSGGF